VNKSVTLWTITRSEWIKFRSVRSTLMGALVTVVLTLGLGALITSTIRAHWGEMDPARQFTFDPVSTSLAGTLFAQFAVGVIGALFITSEYSSGSIRTTLAAVPTRARLIAAKFIVLAVSVLIVSEVVCVGTFLMGQAIYRGVVPTASLGDAAVLRAVLLAGVYLTLLAVLGLALGLILRQSAASISVFTSLLLIVPIIVFLLPSSWQNTIAKFEPSALGRGMMSATAVPPDQTFAAWPSAALLGLYVAALLGSGIAMMVRRDA
jgi:ABC-2 type transport system permease protein